MTTPRGKTPRERRLAVRKYEADRQAFLSSEERAQYRRERNNWQRRLRREQTDIESLRILGERLTGRNREIFHRTVRARMAEYDFRRRSRIDEFFVRDNDPRDRPAAYMSPYEREVRIRDWRNAGFTPEESMRLTYWNKKFYNESGDELRRQRETYIRSLATEYGMNRRQIIDQLNLDDERRGGDLRELFKETGFDTE